MPGTEEEEDKEEEAAAAGPAVAGLGKPSPPAAPPACSSCELLLIEAPTGLEATEPAGMLYGSVG